MSRTSVSTIVHNSIKIRYALFYFWTYPPCG